MPKVTKTDGKAKRWAVAAKRTLPRVVIAAGAAVGAGFITYETDTNNFNALDNSGNTAANYDYNGLSNLSNIQFNAQPPGGVYGPWHSDDVTEVPGDNKADNGPGPGGQGQFRINCDVSHFGNDDPITKPDQPGGAHTHMFWGNTAVNAHTKFNGIPGIAGDKHDLMNSGGSTCQGNIGNRSAYWMPALMDGPASPTQNLILPTKILLYYKSYRPYEVHILPPGVQFIAGNILPDGSSNGAPEQELAFSGGVGWGCHNLGITTGQANIPTNCPATHTIRAIVSFPECLATDNGLITGNPILGSPDFVSHASYRTGAIGPLSNTGGQTTPCPASHPYPIAQISYLVDFPNPDDPAYVALWRLSSDEDALTAAIAPHPGESIHGDWFGGWDPSVIQNWTDGCMDPDTDPAGGLFTNQGVNNFNGPRNCSIGQTGQNANFLATGIPRNLKRITPVNNTTLFGPQPNTCWNCKTINN